MNVCRSRIQVLKTRLDEVRKRSRNIRRSVLTVSSYSLWSRAPGAR
jgi:hypothetical protein